MNVPKHSDLSDPMVQARLVSNQPHPPQSLLFYVSFLDGSARFCSMVGKKTNSFTSSVKNIEKKGNSTKWLCWAAGQGAASGPGEAASGHCIPPCLSFSLLWKNHRGNSPPWHCGAQERKARTGQCQIQGELGWTFPTLHPRKVPVVWYPPLPNSPGGLQESPNS